MSIGTILIEVEHERDRQDVRFGGKTNDDRKFMCDWVHIIRTYAAWGGLMSSMRSRDKARRRLIQVAALAVAAVEAMDRGAAR